MDTEARNPNEREAKEHPETENWTVASDPDLIARTEDRFAEYMQARGWDSNIVADMIIGLDEALKNALYHGNLQVGEVKSQEERSERAAEKLKNSEFSAKKIRVKISVWADKAEVVITDEGKGFDWQKMIGRDITEDLMKETGRGIAFARIYFDEVKYNEAGNEVALIKFKHP